MPSSRGMLRSFRHQWETKASRTRRDRDCGDSRQIRAPAKKMRPEMGTIDVHRRKSEDVLGRSCASSAIQNVRRLRAWCPEPDEMPGKLKDLKAQRCLS